MKFVFAYIILIAGTLNSFAQSTVLDHAKSDSNTRKVVAASSTSLKNNDRVLPKFCIDADYMYGLGLTHQLNSVTTLQNYLNYIQSAANGQTPSSASQPKYNDKSNFYAVGADLGFGYFFGKNRRFGIGIGLQYLYQESELGLQNFFVQYQDSDVNHHTYRSIITLNNPITEHITTTTLNIPVVLKFKHQFKKSPFGVAAEAGGIISIAASNSWNTNASFKYEAIYHYDSNANGKTYSYDYTTPYTTTNNLPNIQVITTNILSQNFNSDDIAKLFYQYSRNGYNVALNKTLAPHSGNQSYGVSFGAVLKASLTYQLNYHLTFNAGVFYNYEVYNNKTGNYHNYRMADNRNTSDTAGRYNTLLNSYQSANVQTWGINVGVRYFFGEKRDIDGDGTPDAKDECMYDFGPAIYHGCPDRDGDGVIDKLDHCPDQQGSTATNGCPDEDQDSYPEIDPVDKNAIDDCPGNPGPIHGCPDRDGDGIADKDDVCPDTFGYEKYHGCPDEKSYKHKLGEIYHSSDTTDETIYTTRNGINVPNLVLKQNTIHFNKDSANILPSDMPTLDAAIEVLKKNPKVCVFLAGHTDSTFTYEFNMKLSFERAEVVKKYFSDRGIADDKIILAGYGMMMPVKDNLTDEDKAQNRRVEMKLIIKL